MSRIFVPFLAVLMLSWLGGCAFITVPLLAPEGPLEEQIVEGKTGPKVLLLNVTGIISDATDRSFVGSNEPSTVSILREELRTAEEERDIRGVILLINSPGGTVTGSDIIYHEILEMKKRTGVPVYAAMLDTAASGGYYIALAADRIYAHPTTITGSIGVISVTLNLEGLMEKFGIESKVKKSGEKKDIFSPYRPDTPEEDEIMQSIVNLLHNRFLDAVEEGRRGRLTRSEIERLADGRPYTATQAVELGLVDDIAYVDDVVSSMAEKLNTKEVRLVRYIRSGDYVGSFYSSTAYGKAPEFSLVRINADSMFGSTGARFLYLWQP